AVAQYYWLAVVDFGLLERLRHLHQAEATISSLPTYQQPSQVVHQLSQYDRPALILLGVRSPRLIRRLIWQYLVQWSQVKAPLDGNDLRAIGYKPGSQFKAILTTLLAATIDGEVSDRTEAEAFLARHYPLS
ncbi:MAG: hypothetical protein F6K19_38640, partial [Cyanothece sp. SIO1E1]|nr:hypothetical protein [Cyanothece sp. SIO1E1]